MSDATRARAWIGLFVALVVAPLALLFVPPRPEPAGFLRELSVALGFAGLSLMGAQFLPTARLPMLRALLPSDTLYAFHRRIAIVGFLPALAHPALLFVDSPALVSLLDVRTAPARAVAATVGTALLLVVVGTSVWRVALGLSYPRWRLVHAVAATVMAGLFCFHMFAVGRYSAHPVRRTAWIAVIALWVAAIGYTRLVRPLTVRSRPYVVDAVRPERGDTWSLRLRPRGHGEVAFLAGQFAWLTTRSPFGVTDNPFSFSSSATRRDQVEFAIKEAGDFTRSVPRLPPGTTVYVDAAYGTFDLEAHPGRGYVLIGGGSGIVPIVSILRTMADRDDPRPVTVVYGCPTPEDITFEGDLHELAAHLDLVLNITVDRGSGDWSGPVGFVDRTLLERAVPPRRRRPGVFHLRSRPDDPQRREVPACHGRTTVARAHRELPDGLGGS